MRRRREDWEIQYVLSDGMIHVCEPERQGLCVRTSMDRVDQDLAVTAEEIRDYQINNEIGW